MKTTNTPRTHLNLETLEARYTPNASFVSNGDLIVPGTYRDDNILVHTENNNGTPSYKVTINGEVEYHPVSSVWGGDIYVYGYEGNDVLNAHAYLRVTAYGHAGNDYLVGSSSTDYLDGGTDSDTIWAYGGHDRLIAGYDSSFNELHGMEGNDTLSGGYGVDVLYGEAGIDNLYGFYGHDILRGGIGTDYLYGQDGNDSLDGGDDGVRDFLYGGGGNDWFQRDMYSVRIGPRLVQFNRDQPMDFTTGDAYYG